VRPVGLRGRVAAAAAVAILVAVAGFGAAVVARLDRQLDGALDRTLRARATDVARLAASAPALLDDPGALDGRLAGSALLVQVVDRRGRLVARSSALGGLVLPDDGVARAALRERRPGYGDERLGGDRIRMYAAPLGELGDGPAAGGAVLAAGPTAELDRTMRSTRLFVVLSGLAAALAAAGGAVLLARRALAPLTRLSSGAQAIERTGDAARRLPPPVARDEVGELTETLNRMLASLERSREAERRFVADASHELRSPLTALRGNAQYAARHGGDPAVLADIEADSRRLGVLLDDLLALAREDASAPVRDHVVDLAAVAEAAAAADERAAVVVAPGAGPVRVRGDRDALVRAVENLVTNARRHGPPGGAITVEVGGGDGRARIAVADQGPGLTPEEAEHAFRRFWRGPAVRSAGSGLGLPIVRATAERHGGRVEVAGARFTLDLPALRDLSGSDRRNRNP
jgi:signal transduction histidine kinase